MQKKSSDLFLKITCSLVLLWAISANLIFSRFDVDVYHDGFIYPAALSVSNGGMPNKDFFSFYGPLSSLAQGYWLKLTDRNLLSLRLHGVILICFIAIVLYCVSSKVLGKNLSFILVAIWMLGHPLIVNPTLPWPDLYVTLLQLISLAYLSYKKSNINQKNFLIVGIILGCAVFFKINFLVPLVVILIMSLMFIKRFYAMWMVGGVVISWITGISLMLMFGTWEGYWNETILYNTNRYEGRFSIRGVFNAKIVFFGFLSFVALFIIKWICTRHFIKRKWIWTATFLNSVLLIFVVLEFRRLNEPFFSFSKNFTDNVLNVLKNAPYWLLFAVIFFAFISGVLLFRKRTQNNLEVVDIFACILGFSTVFFLYPNPEPVHIWYVMPTAILGLFNLKPIWFNNDDYVATKMTLLIPTLIALIVINFEFIGASRYHHTVQPLKGMASDVEIARSIDEIMIRIVDLVGEQEIQNDCMLGLFSVAGNKYRASDRQYVDLVPKFKSKKEPADWVFECNLSNEAFSSLKERRKIEYVNDGFFPYSKMVVYRN